MAEPYVDIVQVRSSGVDPNHPTGFCLEETPYLEQAAYIKAHGVRMLVASVSGWQDPETAENAIAQGKIDLVSMARAWISNPDYGKLVYEGRREDIIPCLRCNKCHGRGPGDPFLSVCSVNPKVGIEHRLHYLTSEPGPSKQIAVVGGGPAGMKAAMELADRGHRVTLFEAGSQLGGAIRHSDYVDFKWPLKNFKNYLIYQVEKRDSITLRLNTRATPELIRAEHFDVVIAALGARPVVPAINGLDSVQPIFAADAMMAPDILGKRVVVIGGGEVGVEAGMTLAKQGHEVTVLEMRDRLAADATMIHYRSMFEEAWNAIPSFHGRTGVTVTGVSPEGVTCRDETGRKELVPADSVVLSVGMKPLREEALAFYDSADRFYLIGDCDKPATIQQAMRAAYGIASNICPCSHKREKEPLWPKMKALP